MAQRDIERVAESLGMDQAAAGWAPCPCCWGEAVSFYTRLNKRGDKATALFFCPDCSAGGNIGRLRKLLVDSSGAP